MVKARVATRQAQRVLPVDPGAHRLGGLTAGQVPRLLEDRHQGEARRRPARPAAHPVDTLTSAMIADTNTLPTDVR
jgi:hypothetical protein